MVCAARVSAELARVAAKAAMVIATRKTSQPRVLGLLCLTDDDGQRSAPEMCNWRTTSCFTAKSF